MRLQEVFIFWIHGNTAPILSMVKMSVIFLAAVFSQYGESLYPLDSTILGSFVKAGGEIAILFDRENYCGFVTF